LRHVGRYYVTFLFNRELVSRAKLYLVSVLEDIIQDCPKMRNLPKIFLRSFKNCELWAHQSPSLTQLVSLAWWSTAVCV